MVTVSSVQTIVDRYCEVLDIRLFVEPDSGIYDAWNKAFMAVDTGMFASWVRRQID